MYITRYAGHGHTVAQPNISTPCLLPIKHPPPARSWVVCFTCTTRGLAPGVRSAEALAVPPALLRLPRWLCVEETGGGIWSSQPNLAMRTASLESSYEVWGDQKPQKTWLQRQNLVFS